MVSSEGRSRPGTPASDESPASRGSAGTAAGSKASRTRGRILEAAERLFADRGYQATRLEDVADAVGVRRAALFYHFSDKGALYEAVLESVFGELLDRARAVLSGEGELLERLEAGVLLWVDYVWERPTTAHLLLREAAQRTEDRDVISRLAGPFLELLYSAYQEGVRRDLFRPVTGGPFHFASTLVGSTIFFVAGLRQLVADLPFDPLTDEQHRAHRRDAIAVMHRLLEINAPEPA